MSREPYPVRPAGVAARAKKRLARRRLGTTGRGMGYEALATSLKLCDATSRWTLIISRARATGGSASMSA